MRRLTLDYLRTEAGAGLLLPAAALVALGLANSAYAGAYFGVLGRPEIVRVGPFAETLTIGGWVRALLMPIFFLVLGMQLKFELLRGELSNPRRLALPLLAALGGLAGPAVIFLGFALAGSPRWSDWAAGSATDGAAALAALTVAGARVAPQLRMLLMSVATVDNLAAAVVAAAAQSAGLRLPLLAAALVVLAALAVLSRWRRAPFLFYAVGFALVWAVTLRSGLDPSLAGIACALTAPVGARRPGQESTLKYFMESLHPYVAFAILPVFLLTTAGVPLHSLHPPALAAAAPIAVMLALSVGKPAGVFCDGCAALGLRWARPPAGAAWEELLAVALLCGIGLTVSYYVAGPAASAPIRGAVLIGSAAAAAAGFALLSWTGRDRPLAAASRRTS